MRYNCDLNDCNVPQSRACLGSLFQLRIVAGKKEFWSEQVLKFGMQRDFACTIDLQWYVFLRLVTGASGKSVRPLIILYK